MPMTAQNAAHGCDCGKVKVTLLGKINAAEALTAPLNGKAIAIDDVADLIYIIKPTKAAIQLRFAKNKQLSSSKGTGGFTVRFLFLLFSKNFSKKC